MKNLFWLICVSLIIQFSDVAFGAEDFPWTLFLPAITMSGPCDPQDLSRCRNDSDCVDLGGYWFDNKCNIAITCTDIAGCYLGSLSDNCPGYTLGGEMGISINANCSFLSVSQYGVKSSGAITGRQEGMFSGAGQTDAEGCGQFFITCTDNSTSVSCSYN